MTGPASIELGRSYLLGERIGAGSTGIVYRGVVRDSGATVAIKVLRAELAEDPEIVARFVQERWILVRLNNEHLVPVLDLVAEGNTLALVSHFVDGPSLRQVLVRTGPLCPADAASVAADLLDGLAAVHANKVVHRDVKPSNVLLEVLGERTVARVTDFGIAGNTSRSTLTRLTSLLGTPDYMAPELGTGQPVTNAADVYSAGIVLYEMLAGTVPFAADSLLAVLRQHADIPLPRTPQMDDELWSVIQALAAKDPADRPDAGAASQRLRQLTLAPSDGRLREAARSDGPPIGAASVSAGSAATEATLRSGESAATMRPGRPPGRAAPKRTRLGVTAVVVAVLALLASAGTYLAVGHGSNPHWSIPRQILGASLLDSVGCTSPSYCTTADFSGDVFEYDGSAWSPLPLPIPGHQGFKAHGAGCLSPTFCSAFFRTGGSTDLYFYDGTTWHPEIVGNRLAGRYPFYLSTIWCPTASSCVAIGAGRSTSAKTATYEDGHWAAPRVLRLGASGSAVTDVPYALSCVSSQFCAALNGSRSPLIDRNGRWSQGRPIARAGALTSVSCTSSTFCAAVDKHGNAYLFDGRTWSTAIRVDPGSADDLLSISCSAQFCGAIDSAGRAVTFSDGSWNPATLIDPGSRPADISCPAANSCMVVDQAGRYVRLS